uniref:Uncharacterized protein n=1 Tax=Ascaris lumbricoides TaxID=6252 RepID=A0A0M3HQS6_ASCLU
MLSSQLAERFVNPDVQHRLLPSPSLNQLFGGHKCSGHSSQTMHLHAIVLQLRSNRAFYPNDVLMPTSGPVLSMWTGITALPASLSRRMSKSMHAFAMCASLLEYLLNNMWPTAPTHNSRNYAATPDYPNYPSNASDHPNYDRYSTTCDCHAASSAMLCSSLHPMHPGTHSPVHPDNVHAMLLFYWLLTVR